RLARMSMRRGVIYIRRNSDGIIRESKWQDGSCYWWTEGNASCDCNRALAFDEGILDDEGVLDLPCGEDGYSLVNADGTPFTAWGELEEKKPCCTAPGLSPPA